MSEVFRFTPPDNTIEFVYELDGEEIELKILPINAESMRLLKRMQEIEGGDGSLDDAIALYDAAEAYLRASLDGDGVEAVVKDAEKKGVLPDLVRAVSELRGKSKPNASSGSTDGPSKTAKRRASSTSSSKTSKG